MGSVGPQHGHGCELRGESWSIVVEIWSLGHLFMLYLVPCSCLGCLTDGSALS